MNLKDKVFRCDSSLPNKLCEGLFCVYLSVKYGTLSRQTVALLHSQALEIRVIKQYEYKTDFNLNV